MRDHQTWRLTLLDDVELRRPNDEIVRTGRKALALLAYLATQRGRSARRDVLARLLWPQVGDTQARASLRQVLTALRRSQDDHSALLASDDLTVALLPEVEIDLLQFEALAAGTAHDRRAAASLYHADLLAGFSLVDSEAFNDWLAIEQARWRQVAVGVFSALVDEAQNGGGMIDAGVQAALRLLAIEPFNEAAHRALMSLYVKQGRSAQAIQHFRDLTRALQHELQVAPETATLALAHELRLDRRRGTRAPSSPPPSAETPLATAPETPSSPRATTLVKRTPSRPSQMWRIGAAVVVLGLATMGGLTLLSMRRSAPITALSNVQPIIEGDQRATRPDLSPDGAHVVYAMRHDGDADLYVAATDGSGQPVRLTDRPGREDFPVWRPDGKAIAFMRLRPGRPCEILLRPFPVGEETSIADCLSPQANGLAWSADGATLFFADGPKDVPRDRLYQLDLARGTITPLTNPPEESHGDMTPQVSPDGRRIAFRRLMGPMAIRLMVRDLRSGQERMIVESEQGLWGPAWAGDDLIYAAGVGGDSALWRIDSRGRDVATRLSPGLVQYLGVSVARASDRIAFEVREARRTLLHVARQAGARPEMILGRQFQMTQAVAEAPNGDRAVVLRRQGVERIWLLPKGGVSRPVGQPGRSIHTDLAWSPDGRRLAYLCGEEARTDICVLDISTGAERRLTNDAANERGPAWSPDGRSLYFGARRGDDGWRIWRIDAEGGDARAVTPSGIRFARPDAEARHLYYARLGRAGLWRRLLAPNGVHGDEEQVLDDLSVSDEDNWFIDGAEVVYVRRGDGEAQGEVWRRDLNNGSQRIILSLPNLSQSHALARSGREGVLVVTETQSADIIGAVLSRR
ncbi:translocation protein TolB [compost metagenome]